MKMSQPNLGATGSLLSNLSSAPRGTFTKSKGHIAPSRSSVAMFATPTIVGDTSIDTKENHMDSIGIRQHASGDFKEELMNTAKEICSPGKGLLAADESTGTIGKRFDGISLENNHDNR